MGQLFPYLQWFWGAVVFAIIVGAVTNRLYGPIHDDAWTFLRADWALISLPLLGIGALTFWSWLTKRRHARQEETQTQWQAKEREQQKRTQQVQRLQESFALFKPVPDFRPEDLEFRQLKPGETMDPRYGFDKRPFYSTYIPRRAIAYDQLNARDDQDVFDEVRLAHELSQGRGFGLLGQPLDGKARTLYEIVRQLAGYHVVRPTIDSPTPPDEAFALLKGRRVIVLLDDLNSYASRVPDLREFAGKLGRNADTWTVAATCRDGPELGVVREAIGTSLRRFYEGIPLKLGLLPLTVIEKAQLARGIGRGWNLQESEYFPTPGSITMEEALKAMSERFETLVPEQKDALRGLKLLTAAGILPLTHLRLEAILQHLFNRTVHFGDCLDSLAAQSFIRRPARQDPIQPESAYLQDAVAYINGKTPQDDFPSLVGVLEAIPDVEGLFYLGNMYGMSLKRYRDAFVMYERVLQLRPKFPEAWHNKGIVLRVLGRYPDALQACEQALRLRPEFPEAWYNKGVALWYLERYPEALQAYERALQLRLDDPAAWQGKGFALQKLGRDQEAQQAYTQAKRLRPSEPLPNH